MVDNPKAAIMIIAVISILAFAVGCVVGSFHVGQDYCEQIIPTSISSSDDMIKPIKETNTTMYNVSIKQPQQQKKVTKNYTKTNTTNNTTSNSSGNGSGGYNRSGSGNYSYPKTNNGTHNSVNNPSSNQGR
ncbi:MAG: hypothetical protein Q4Q22_00470 [Methanosphaera sp.]|nr:hypothetical protein [Methanosphaera sp.]